MYSHFETHHSHWFTCKFQALFVWFWYIFRHCLLYMRSLSLSLPLQVCVSAVCLPYLPNFSRANNSKKKIYTNFCAHVKFALIRLNSPQHSFFCCRSSSSSKWCSISVGNGRSPSSSLGPGHTYSYIIFSCTLTHIFYSHHLPAANYIIDRISWPPLVAISINLDVVAGHRHRRQRLW